ncbi:MAG: transglycosylase SLT domain-containing protein [Thermodesulfobacteriota bacterium]
MRKNILMFFFCAAVLGVFSAARAESAPVPAEGAPALRASLPAVGVESIKASTACVLSPPPPTDGAEADGVGAPGGAACVEEDAPAGAAYLYYEDSAGPGFEVCLKDAVEEAAAFYVLNEEPLPRTEGKVCLDAPQVTVDDSIPGVPIVVNKNVESFIKYFQTSGRKYFERWWDRSQKYMVMIRAILRENGLPEDLSYIAFIESGLNPKARSRSNAVGMWQFIKGTAVRYGLRVDWWMDERMDPEKSTQAAARYFTDLYDRFGSWYLAAAGYNAGEGRVSRAVKKHGTDDFWALARHKRTLRRETRNYVPKYLAALMISKDPVSYGFEELEYREGPPYEKVKVSGAIDLRVIARAAGASLKEIKDLNPELRRWFTPPDYPGYEVKIPVGATERFVENMSKIPPAKKIAFLRHRIRRGDTLYHIARRYKTSVKPIMYLNNLRNARRLRPGMVLVIPVRAERLGKRASNASDVVAQW